MAAADIPEDEDDEFGSAATEATTPGDSDGEAEEELTRAADDEELPIVGKPCTSILLHYRKYARPYKPYHHCLSFGSCECDKASDLYVWVLLMCCSSQTIDTVQKNKGKKKTA